MKRRTKMGIDTATPQEWDKAFDAVTRQAH